MDQNDNELNLLRKKVDAYFLLGEKVHIKYRNSSNWRRGIIKEVKTEFFMLEETKLGMMPIFFSEIYSIEKYSTRGEINGVNAGAT